MRGGWLQAVSFAPTETNWRTPAVTGSNWTGSCAWNVLLYQCPHLCSFSGNGVVRKSGKVSSKELAVNSICCLRLFLLQAWNSDLERKQNSDGSKGPPVATRNTAPYRKVKKNEKRKGKKKKTTLWIPCSRQFGRYAKKSSSPLHLKMQSKRTMKMEFFSSCHCRNV